MGTFYDDLLGAEKVTNRYDELLEEQQQAERQQLQGSLEVGSKHAPDRRAEVIRIADRVKIDADTVDRQLEEFKKPRPNYDKLIAEQPVTSAFLQDPDNASVAHDDIDNLSTWEWIVKTPGQEWGKGTGMVELGQLGTKAMNEGLNDAEEKRVAELNGLLSEDSGGENFFSRIYAGTFRGLPPILGALGAGVEKGIPTAVTAMSAAALAGPGSVVTVPAAAAAGLAAGGAWGAGVFSQNLEGGHAYLEFRAIQDVNGKPIDPAIAKVAAQSVGIVNALLETVGIGVLVRSFPGARRVLSNLTTTGVKEVLKRPTAQAALGRLVTRYTGVVGAEVGTEVVQEAVTIIAGELAKGEAEFQHGGKFERIGFDAAADRLMETMVKAFEEMAVISILGPGVGYIEDAGRAKKATERQKTFDALASTDSKLRERLPEKFRDFVAKATEDGPVQTVYIPAEKFVEYFQGAGIKPEEALAKMPDVAAQLEERLASGGDLAIPMADFAAYIAPSDHYKGLSQDLRFNPEDMTFREAQAWEKEQEKLTEEAKGEAGKIAEDDPIFADVVAQLEATGMEKGTAEKNATLMASVFNTLAKRTGQDPQALYDRYKVKIQRGQADELQAVVESDNLLDAVLEEIRAEPEPAAAAPPVAEDVIVPPGEGITEEGETGPLEDFTREFKTVEEAFETFSDDRGYGDEATAEAARELREQFEANNDAQAYVAAVEKRAEEIRAELEAEPADAVPTLQPGQPAGPEGMLRDFATAARQSLDETRERIGNVRQTSTGYEFDFDGKRFAVDETNETPLTDNLEHPELKAWLVRQMLDKKQKPVKKAKPVAIPPPAPAPPPAGGRGIGGGANQVKIEDRYVPAQYVAIEADELAPALDKAENQYRDRNRAAAQAQVRAIAANIDFNMLGASPTMDYGAPTIALDGRVIGGNGRILGVRDAYKIGKGPQYKDPLVARASEFGLDPKAVAAMDQPVLVRVLTEDVDVKRAAIASNEGGALRMSALEQAKVDAERLGALSDFDIDDDGQINIARSRAGIRAWVGKQPATQRGALVDAQGQLSAEGLQRLRNAILYRAYGDSPTLARLIDAVDPGSRNIAAALMRVAPKMAELRQGIETGDRYPLDISDDLQAAVERIIRIRETGQSVAEALKQQDIFGAQLSAEAEVIIRFMGDSLRSSRSIAQFLERYADAVERAGSPKQADVFGPKAVPSKLELLEEASQAEMQRRFEDRGGAQSALFQGPAPRPEIILNQDTSSYFTQTPKSVAISTGVLVPTNQKAADKAIAKMQASARGEYPRRKPIDVRIDATGNFLVIDGNETLAGAKALDVPAVEAEVTLELKDEKMREYEDQLTVAQKIDLAEQARDAAAFIPEMNRELGAIVGEVGGMLIPASGKTDFGYGRIVEKVVLEYGGDTSRMKDMARATILVETRQELSQALELVLARFGQAPRTDIRRALLDARNLDEVVAKDPYGYADVKVNIPGPNGRIYEIQLTTPDLKRAKSERGHDIYREARSIEAQIAARVYAQGGEFKSAREAANAGMKDEEVAELEALRQESIAVYAPALERFFTSSSKAGGSRAAPSSRMNEGRTGRQVPPGERITPRLRKATAGAPSTLKNAEPAGQIGAASIPSIIPDKKGAKKRIAKALKKAGIDLKKVGNKEARKALRSGRFFQSAAPVESQAFQAWFGDSKVVDENGEPLVVYHATGASFDQFEITGDIGFHFGTAEAANDRAAEFPGRMTQKAANVMPVYLSIQNPLRLPDMGTWDPGEIAQILVGRGILDAAQVKALYKRSTFLGREKLIELLEAAGYDGIVYVNRGEGIPWEDEAPRGVAELATDNDYLQMGAEDSYIAFHPEQIKSAIGNRGTFNRQSGHILFQPAFHGSPYDFDRFSTQHIGSGEGAQAFGWGLYFAEADKVAEGYARALGGDALKIGGQAVKFTRDSDQGHALAVLHASMVPSRDMAAAYAAARRSLALDLKAENARREKYGHGPADFAIAAVERQIGILNGWQEAEAVPTTGGTLYQVEIDDGAVGRMMLGDEFVGLQPPSVMRALKMIAPGIQPEMTGLAAYNFAVQSVARLGRQLALYNRAPTMEESLGGLAERFGVSLKLDNKGEITAQDQDRILAAFAKHREDMKPREWLKVRSVLSDDSAKIVSEFLAEVGIPGIKYLDAGSRFPVPFVNQLADSKWQVTWYTGTPLAMRTQNFASEAEAQEFSESLDKSDSQTYNFVVFDEDVVEITHKDGSPVTAKERRELMQSQLNQPTMAGPRAKIQLGESTIISLFDNADLSSTLHESGHLYLEMFGDAAERPDAPQQLKDDYAATLKWLGVEKRADIGVAQHEQWARGFEAYLYEGKAPNTALQNAFARFRAWLVAIYRDVKNLNVTLTPSVRAVMDRLVATDDEIRAAQESQNYVALFTSAEEAGYSPQEFEAYKKAIVQARMEAEESLTRSVLQDLTREQKAWWKEERDKIRNQVIAETHAMPVYRALAFLQRGKNPDGSELDGVTPAKLNRAALILAYGEDFLKRLPRPYIYSKEDGVAPDIVGAMFDYDSGDAMVREIVAAPPMKKRIEDVTDQRMEAQFGNQLLDGSLVEKAMDAVHNEHRADLIAREMRALRKLERQVAPALNAREAQATRDRRQSREANASMLPDVDERRIITRAAQQAIALRRIRDIRPHEYRVAEARASRLAFEAAGKGDYEVAYREKRKQLLNHELYRAAVAARDRTDKIVEFMRGFAKPRKRAALGKAGADYLEQIDALLERFDFRARGPSQKTRMALVAWADQQRSHGAELSVPAWLLDEARRTPYKELTFEELQGLHDIVVNIDHLSRLKNKLLARQDQRELQAVIDDIVAGIDANHTRKLEPFEFAPSLGKRVVQGLAHAAAEHTKPEFIADFLDGEKPLGPVWEALFKPLADAESQEQAMQRAAREKIRDIFAAYSPAERKAMLTMKIKAPEIGQSVTKGTLLAIALNTGNEYNREVLLKGYKWSEGQLGALLSRLEARDWETVQAIWDFIDGYWPEIAALQKELTGLSPEKVEAMPFRTQGGQAMRGGYYPIKYDSRLSWRQQELDQTASINELYGGAYSRVATRHGHTIERTNSGGKAIKLEIGVLLDHVVNVIHDLSHRRAILDVDRLVTNDAVREAIEQTAGKAMYGQFRPWLKNIAADFKPHLTRVEAILDHLRAGATVVSMGWKITTALVQPLGYAQSVELLGAKYSGIGLNEFYGKGHPIRSMQRGKDFAFERSEQLRNRMKTFDRDIREHFKHMTETEKSAPVRRSFFFLTGLLDMSVAIPTWLGAYRKAMDGAAEGIDAGNEPQAIDYADKILRMSQSAGGAKDLAAVQYSHPLMRLFTTFYSYFSVFYNLFQRAMKRTNWTRPRDYPRFVASMFALWIVPAVLSEIVAGRGPDDDEDWDEYAKRSAFIWATYPLQSIVFVRDVVTAMGPYGYDGPPALDAISATGRTLNIPLKALDDDEEITRADMRAVFDAAGYWGQIPSRQMWITGSYLYDWGTGLEEPETVGEAVEGLAFTRRQ